MSALTRALRAPVAILVLTTSMSCSKGPTTSPGDAQPESQAVQLRYAEGAASLTQTSEVQVTSSGGGEYSELNASLAASLALGKEGDNVKVVWKIDTVGQLELKGALELKGEPPMDGKAILLEKGHGAWVMDGRGETNQEATNELAENAERRKELAAKAETDAAKGAPPKPSPEDQMLFLVQSSLFQMPTLPAEALEVGSPLKLEEEEETELGEGGIVLPIVRERTYTVVDVDASSGKRVVELQIEDEAGGKAEYQGGELVVTQSTEATLLFNLDEGLPVSVQRTTTQNFRFVPKEGEEMSNEFITIVRSEYAGA